MMYKAQYMIPVVVEIEAVNDTDAEQQAEAMSTEAVLRMALKQNGIMGADFYPNALITSDGRTVLEV